MKKLILTLGFVLGLGGLTATQAQMKVLSNGNVKMGNLSTSTSTTYGLEIGYSQLRIHPAATAASMAGAANDIYIYGECTPITGGGIVYPSSYSSFTKCTAIIKGDNLQVGTMDNPVKVYERNSVNVNASGVSAISDRRYKDNIRPMESGLAEILQLQPVRFDYKRLNDNEYPWDSLARFNKVGFIAQEVESIVPEAVTYDVFDDLYLLNQTDFIPYMVAGIQEMNGIIEKQNETILALTDRIERLEAGNAALSTPAFSNVRPDANPAETVAATGNRLWSNVPNPFKQETRIRYALTDDVREARLCIYDLSGRQLSCHRLNDRGQSEFVLRAASLNPGIYLYSLIADGQVVDTHRMVVTE